jgi:hypothetical protein
MNLFHPRIALNLHPVLLQPLVFPFSDPGGYEHVKNRYSHRKSLYQQNNTQYVT